MTNVGHCANVSKLVGRWISITLLILYVDCRISLTMVSGYHQWTHSWNWIWIICFKECTAVFLFGQKYWSKCGSRKRWIVRDWEFKDENLVDNIFDIAINDQENIIAKKLNLCIHDLPSVQFADKSVHYCIAIRFWSINMWLNKTIFVWP